MPTVPRYERSGVQEQGLSISRQPASAPIEAFGGGAASAQVSRSASGLADVANEIAVKATREADEIAITDADRRIADLETKLLHDSKTGALNVKGKDSFGLPDSVMEEYEKSVSEITEGLANDFQKRSFYEASRKRGAFINRSLQNHVSKEKDRYDSEVTKSYVENERNAAINNFEDSERIGLSIQRQKGAIIAHAKRNGLSIESQKLMLAESVSSTHSGILSKLMNGGADLMAKDYYKENKENMLPDDREHMDKLLKKSLLLGEGQRGTDKIIKKTEVMGEALEMARSIKDPDLRDETVSRVKQRFAEKKASDLYQKESDYQAAFGAIEDQRSFDAIPKDVLERIPATDQRKLKNHLTKLQEGKPDTTDWGVYYKLEMMAASPETRDKFLTTPLITLKTSLSDGDFKKMLDLQKEMRKGSMDKADGLTSKNSIINGGLREMGIDISTKAKPSEVQSANLFRQKVDQLNMQFHKDNGRGMNTKELRETIKELQYDVVEKKGWFGYDTTKRIYEYTPDNSPVIRLQNIPDDERANITNALKRNGKAVTDENIVYYYGKKINSLLKRTQGN